MKIIDLFAGCGGLSLGFEKQGFKSLGYVDWDECCIKSLKLNFNAYSKIFVHQDIRESIKNPNKDTKKLFKKSINNVDGIIGGPPCQAYSIAGRIRDTDNMKNDCNLIKEFLYKNVYNHPNIYKKKKEAKKIIIKLFDYFVNNFESLPNDWLLLEKEQIKHRIICDYISGMTDRYAINLYNSTK